MIRFAIIDPTAQLMRVREFESFEDAVRGAGLEYGAIDFGQITRRLTIVVGEFGLFEPMDTQRYFVINKRLFAGPAVLYAADDEGNTINISEVPTLKFYAAGSAVEAAMKRGEIIRPEMAVNGEVIWQWPGERPSPETITDRLRKAI